MRGRERSAHAHPSPRAARCIAASIALTALLGACGADEATTVVSTAAEAVDAATASPVDDPAAAGQAMADTTTPGTATSEPAPSATGGSADIVIDVEMAASTVAHIIRVGADGGPEPGPCPYGPTADLAAALPDDALLAPLRAGPVVDDGQLWTGAQPNLIYCPISVTDRSIDRAEIEEFRVDVASGDVDVIDYLDQNFAAVGPDEVIGGADLLGGGSVGVCHDAGCTAAWTGGGLFVAITLIDTPQAQSTLGQASAALVPIVPLVVERLTELGLLLAEIDALARSYWDGVYDDAIWGEWDATVQRGDTEAFTFWVDYEVEAATITREQSDALLGLLDRLP